MLAIIRLLRFAVIHLLWIFCVALTVCDSAFATSSKLLKQGEYVARAADCITCHTSEGGKLFAGGDPLATPFGKISAPNISPDTQTGIGTWTKAEFARALRQGIRKDGALLYPAMPYTSYTKMTDEDLNALWVYMRSIPATQHLSPDNTFSFPLNIRNGLVVWQSLYFNPGRFTSFPGKDPVWNRGAYLVQALGHCGACHTPRNIAEAPKQKSSLTGAQIEGWYAPDISNDPLSKLTAMNIDELAKFLKTGEMTGNVKSFGPMQQVIHDSLSYLSSEDLHAMAVYLKNPPGNVKSQPFDQAVIPNERLADGKQIYSDNCSSCHQIGGNGITGTVPALAGNTAVTAREPSNVIMAVLEGFKPQGMWGAMGSYASVLNDQQISDVVNYVRTAWGNNGERNATWWSVGNWRTMTTAEPHEHPQMICPVITKSLLQPAFNEGPQALKLAAKDHDELVRIVDDYTTARPQASAGEVIDALSTAYCDAVSSDSASNARTITNIAEFTQQVAIVLVHKNSASMPNPKFNP